MSRKRSNSSEFAVSLMPEEATELARIASAWGVSTEEAANLIFKEFVRIAENAGSFAIFDFGKIDGLLCDCFGYLAEVRLQLQSLCAIQQHMLERCGFDSVSLPNLPLEGAKAVQYTLSEFPSMGLIRNGICAIIGESSKTGSVDFCCKISGGAMGKTSVIFGVGRLDALQKRLIELFDLSLAGIFVPTSNGAAEDFKAMKSLEGGLLERLGALSRNMERLAGKIEACSKEIIEANSPGGL